MSQIKPLYLLIAAALAFALGGCGDTNSQAVFSPESGHPSDWKLTHKSSARENLESCAECHGENLDGGIAGTASKCSNCHPAALEAVSRHPLAWGDYAYARHKKYVADKGTSECANAACHGPALSGVAGSGPACATACHLGGTNQKHPAAWVQGVYSSHKNYMKANKYNAVANTYDSASCKIAACHGSTGKGVFLSGPACDQCHTMK